VIQLFFELDFAVRGDVNWFFKHGFILLLSPMIQDYLRYRSAMVKNKIVWICARAIVIQLRGNDGRQPDGHTWLHTFN
jgi:hypothetical protein